MGRTTSNRLLVQFAAIAIGFVLHTFSDSAFAGTFDLVRTEPVDASRVPQADARYFRYLNSNLVLLNTGMFASLQGVDSYDVAFPERIVMPLPGFGSVTLLFKEIDFSSNGSVTWTGVVEGSPDSSVVLSNKQKVLQGNINYNGGVFHIRYVMDDASGNAIHTIGRLDVTSIPPEHDPSELPLPSGVSPSRNSRDGQQGATSADDGSVIDVMVAYTPAARVGAGGQSAMDSLIALAVAETNMGYANSNVNFTINLSYSTEVSYTESGSFSTDLSRLQNTSDGYMDSIHTDRNTYYADLVSLIIDGGQYCGIGYLNADEFYGFQVTAYNCATGYYSFAHEFGHNMSARHDWSADSTNNSPYTYNHGYYNAPESWRTIMSYNNSACNPYCDRQNYWSNPNVQYPGTGSPMGVPEGSFQAAENWKALNNRAYDVANFRQRPVGQTCNGLTVTVNIANGEVPTAGDDVILGTINADNINALAGNDTICAGSGNDNVQAGGGNDWIEGGAGNDTLNGESGTDEIYGGVGADLIYGGGEDDLLYGEAGADTIYGQVGNDLIEGGDAPDHINGGPGDDFIDTGGGNTVGTGRYATGSGGNDTIYGGPNNDDIRGSNGADTIYAGAGNDVITGGYGRDEIYGQGGADNIKGQQSRDTLYGGAGDDIVDGGGENDVVNGDEGDDQLNGGPGDDSLYGGPGSDDLKGGSNDDYLEGGPDSGDVCDGQTGTDITDASCEIELHIPDI